jgi:hypothetical protein
LLLLKGYGFYITLEISFSEVDMGRGISRGYEALGIIEMSASGIGGKS